MKIKRTLCCILAVVVCIGALCSCSDAKILSTLNSYSVPEKLKMVGNCVLEENERMSLEWDYEQQCLILWDNLNGCVWSTTPYDYYSDTEKDFNFFVENGLRSMLRITYIEPEKNLEMQATSYNDAITAGYVSGKKIDNGIRLIFYFDKIGISVPLEFTLEEDGMSVSIPIHAITENENRIYSVSILPFFASAKNNSDSYLFVPSGSGALMYTDDKTRESRSYSERIYGNDAVNQTIFKKTENESIRMPVFGVKNEDKSLLGIVSQGAELASVEASAGDSQYGYSCVYTNFELRGKSSTIIKDVDNNNAQVTKYSEALPGIERISVRYIVLDSNDGDYNGMAATYRCWLDSEYGLKKNVDSSAVTIDFLGGEQTKKFFLGIPHTSTDVSTTFAQVQEIVEDFIDKTKEYPTVRLRGFGATGLDYGTVADNFTVSDIFGGKKELKSLLQYCKKQNIDAYLDFDTVFYSKTGGGFSVRNAATSANTVRAKYYSYDLVTHKQDPNSPIAFLLPRGEIGKISSKLLKATDSLELTGIGLSTLSNTSYSDYRNQLYFVSANMASDVQKVLKTIKKSDIRVMSDSANVYAAVLSDCIFNTPPSSSRLFVFDEDIPFYQMVLHGYTNLCSQSINLSADPKTAFLNAVSVGNSLSFTCIYEPDQNFINGNHSEISYSVYKDISNDMAEYVSQAADLINTVANKKILSFSRQGNLTCTEFSSGVTVYVNFGTSSVSTPIGEVAARSFIYEK